MTIPNHLDLYSPETSLFAVTFPITNYPKRQPVDRARLLDWHLWTVVEHDDLVSPIRHIRIPDWFLYHLSGPHWIVFVSIVASDVFGGRGRLRHWSRRGIGFRLDLRRFRYRQWVLSTGFLGFSPFLLSCPTSFAGVHSCAAIFLVYCCFKVYSRRVQSGWILELFPGMLLDLLLLFRHLFRCRTGL